MAGGRRGAQEKQVILEEAVPTGYGGALNHEGVVAGVLHVIPDWAGLSAFETVLGDCQNHRGNFEGCRGLCSRQV